MSISMTARRHDQKLARALQDFAKHDGVDVPYTRLLRFAQEKVVERRPEESKSEFAARLWIEHGKELA